MRKCENECSGEIPAVKTVGFSGVKLNNYLESRLKTKSFAPVKYKAFATCFHVEKRYSFGLKNSEGVFEAHVDARTAERMLLPGHLGRRTVIAVMVVGAFYIDHLAAAHAHIGGTVFSIQ